MPAFEQAIRKGADWIEMDLTLTRDGEVVVSHDFSLWRRARSRRRLDDLSLAELGRVDVSRGFPAFSPTAVPRLREVLAVIGARVPLYLELKSEGGGRRRAANRQLLRRCLELLPASSAHALASFDTGLVRGALQAGRRAILILSDPVALTRLSASEGRALYAVSARQDRLTDPFVKRIREEGQRIWTWTVDSERELLRALELGASGICGNDVARLRAALTRHAGDSR